MSKLDEIRMIIKELWDGWYKPMDDERLAYIATKAEEITDKIRLVRMEGMPSQKQSGREDEYVSLPDALEAVGQSPEPMIDIPRDLKIAFNLHHHYIRERLIGAARRKGR